MENVLRVVTVIVVAYLLGSLNASIIMSRFFKKTDIREYGSGNAGITNYLRSFGGKSAAVVALIDVGKCVAATMFGRFIFEGLGDGYLGVLLAGFCVLLGHMFPVFFGFKGGKGVLSMAALMLIFDWRIFLIGISIFIIIVLVTRYVSLGSVVAVLSVIPLIYLFNSGNWLYTGVTALLAGLVVFMHRSNIVRLVKGTESKFSVKKK
ncbi:glycerol-3-phosphate 1-O-acyltransferase PlsY [Oscillospiraceae bacterium OttesenSCG-928-F05]|nr:glycerol-3-phosphate 1-O-acyltransferase PlsY [Oscillospiraceae bacterium OttesenSCG-928-F05]